MVSQTTSDVGSEPARQQKSTITVKIWEGDELEDYGTILSQEPETCEFTIDPNEADEDLNCDHKIVSNDDNHNARYALNVEADIPVTLHIETSTDEENMHEEFEQGKPIRGGMTFHPGEENDPFCVPTWGCVRIRVEPHIT